MYTEKLCLLKGHNTSKYIMVDDTIAAISTPQNTGRKRYRRFQERETEMEGWM